MRTIPHLGQMGQLCLLTRDAFRSHLFSVILSLPKQQQQHLCLCVSKVFICTNLVGSRCRLNEKSLALYPTRLVGYSTLTRIVVFKLLLNQFKLEPVFGKGMTRRRIRKAKSFPHKYFLHFKGLAQTNTHCIYISTNRTFLN